MRVGIVVRKNSCRLLNNVPTRYLLKGVTAYVEVKTNHEDRSACVTSRLKSMGAKISKRLSSRCSHLVFKDGSLSTYNKAKNLSLHIVSVSWIEACRKEGTRLSEANYPCCNRKSYESPSVIKQIKFLFSKSSKTTVLQHNTTKDAKKSPNTKLSRKKNTKQSISANTQAQTKDDQQRTYNSLKPKVTTHPPSHIDADSHECRTKNITHDVYEYDEAVENTPQQPPLKYTRKYSSTINQNEANALDAVHDSKSGANTTIVGIDEDTIKTLSTCKSEDFKVSPQKNLKGGVQKHNEKDPDTEPESTWLPMVPSLVPSLGPNDQSYKLLVLNSSNKIKIKKSAPPKNENSYTPSSLVRENSDMLCVTNKDDNTKLCTSTSVDQAHTGITSSNIILEIKSICLRILNKHPDDDTSNIITKNRNSMKSKGSQSDGHIEAQIISNCAKILGYTVQ